MCSKAPFLLALIAKVENYENEELFSSFNSMMVNVIFLASDDLIDLLIQNKCHLMLLKQRKISSDLIWVLSSFVNRKPDELFEEVFGRDSEFLNKICDFLDR